MTPAIARDNDMSYSVVRHGTTRPDMFRQVGPVQYQRTQAYTEFTVPIASWLTVGLHITPAWYAESELV
ncbi:hypothetical protein J6590_025558 [Homalodisca vitripennis]|nr:hypothetical protein J6590_025558 [Homalodisca vitripennis]